MKTILDQYKIQFLTRSIPNLTYKTASSPYGILNQFLTDFRTVDDINIYFLPILNDVLNGTNSQDTFISESIAVLQISIDISKFYDDLEYSLSDNPLFSLPTNDLKEIVIEWLKYIQL